MSKFKLLLSVIAMMLLGSTAIMAQESKGYALFGAVPEGYEDLTSKVKAEAVGSATFVDGVFTGAGLPGRICESGNYLKMSFTEAQALTLTEDFEVHVVLAKKEAATGDVQAAFCNNGWSAARLGYIIPNASINETATDIVLNYKDYSPDNWNSFEQSKFIGTPVTFPAAEIFRLCAASGEQFEITQIYIEAPHTLAPTEIPNQDPQRIYLRKGTAATPAGVAETADYTATTSVSSVFNNCEASETFFGITTLVREWWLNFQLKSSADVDLTPVYSTWNLVFRVKNGVVNEGQDRGLTVKVNGQDMLTVTTYADANSFVTYALPLKEVILGTNNLGNIATGGTIIDFSTGNNNEAGRAIEFDYIYLTNETEPIPANVSASATATAWNKVELSLYAECATSTKVTYEVTYGSTTKTFTGNAGATTTCVIDGLEGSTEYTFSVVAKNSAGEAEPKTANATTPAEPEVIGYAIFGEVPEDYVDLTGKIKIPDGVVADGIISLSGTSHSDHICHDASKSLVLKVASEAVNMNLTEQFAIHVKIKKTTGVTNDVHVSFNKNDWNHFRAGFRMNTTNIPEDAFKDMVIRYDSKIANGGGQYYCEKPEQLYGNQTWNANGDFLRFAAASGEILYISQIYIEKTYTPEPAPTIVTAEVDESATEWDKVTLNLKANCEKSTVVTYEVTYGSTTKTFTGNAGETTTYVIDGLQAETEYTFTVVAKNEDGVAATAEIEATTDAKPATAEVRYYFYRTGDLPANSADLLNIDMRDGKGSTISTNQASKVAEETTFSKYLMSKSWGFVQVRAKESSLEDVTGDWYLCVRYKSTHPGDVYVNVAASDKSMLLLAEKENNDNLWKTKKVKLSDFLNTSYSFPVAANSDLFQFETNDNNASERGYLTVDYAYLTNNENSEDLGYQDVTAPVMTVSQTDLTATSVSFNIAGIDDSDSKIYYTISDGTNNYEFTYNSKEAFDYQLTGLEKGTDYTITITAKDPFGNQSTWSQAITTVGDATAPEMVSVNKGEVLDNSIELLLKANDNQEGTLTYTISVGGNTYTTTGLAGEEVSYKVTSLTPETEYEFSVLATDAGENTSAPIVVKYSTTAFVAYRYYLVGEGDASNPNHIAVACNTEYANSTCYQDERILDYYSIKANTTWMAVNFKPVETKPNTINTVDADNWYIVMRMRSSMDNNVFGYYQFRVNLENNGQNFYLNTSDWGVTLGDGQWHIVKFKLSAATGTVPSQFLQKDQIAVQLHVNGNLQKDEFFDIDYLYFTNEVVEDNGTQDGYKILLRDTKDNTALLNTYNAQTVDVDLNRSFVADGAWYTLCLPFPMTADQVNAAFGACKLAKLNGSELRGSSLIHLNFDYVNTIEAGVPYLFMPMADVKPVIIEDVKIDNTLKPIETTYFNMNGIFYPTQVATGDYFLGSNNYLYPVQESDNSSLKGLRAYFTIGAGAPANAQARVVMAPTVTTDLQENTITTTAEKVIKDGTIYILRGDKIYTTTGQLVK